MIRSLSRPKLGQVWRRFALYRFAYMAKSEVTLVISELYGCIVKEICLERRFGICLSCQCWFKCCAKHDSLHFILHPPLPAGPFSIRLTRTLEERRSNLGVVQGLMTKYQRECEISHNVPLWSTAQHAKPFPFFLTRTDCSGGFLWAKKRSSTVTSPLSALIDFHQNDPLNTSHFRTALIKTCMMEMDQMTVCVM